MLWRVEVVEGWAIPFLKHKALLLPKFELAVDFDKAAAAVLLSSLQNSFFVLRLCRKAALGPRQPVVMVAGTVSWQPHHESSSVSDTAALTTPLSLIMGCPRPCRLSC